MTFDIGIPITDDELDVLLQTRLNLSRAEVIAALKMLPFYRARTGSMTAEEARLLDAAGLADDPANSSRISIEAIATMAWLVKTAYTGDEVAKGLGISRARVGQRRRARSSWAVDDNARGHIQRCSSTSSKPVDAAHSRWFANLIGYYELSQPMCIHLRSLGFC